MSPRVEFWSQNPPCPPEPGSYCICENSVSPCIQMANMGTVNQPCSPLERSGLVGMQPLLLGPVRTGRAGGCWPSLTPGLRSAQRHSSSGSEAVPAARPGFPTTRTCHLTRSQARWLPGCCGARAIGWRYLGWAVAGPLSLGSSRCHVGTSLLSPASAAERRLPAEGSTRNFSALEWVGRLPHTQNRACPNLPA